MGLLSLDGSLPTDDAVDQLIPKDERARVMAEQEANRERVEFYRTVDEAKQVQFTKVVPKGRLVEVQSSHDIDLEQPELVIKELDRILQMA
jgi:hypothetical protein